MSESNAESGRQQALILLERLGRLLQSRGNDSELQPVHWEALRYLARANRFSRTPGSLTAYLGSTKGTVSQTLIALERKGLVRKKSDRTDRRAVRLELTAAGRRALQRDPLFELGESLGPLKSNEEAVLRKSLARILEHQLSLTGSRAFGICHTCRHFERDVNGGKPHRCALLDVALSDDDSERICVEQEL